MSGQSGEPVDESPILKLTDEFEKVHLERQVSLKQSKEFVESQGRLYIKRDERQYKLLSMFEKMQDTNKLELASFKR